MLVMLTSYWAKKAANPRMQVRNSRKKLNFYLQKWLKSWQNLFQFHIFDSFFLDGYVIAINAKWPPEREAATMPPFPSAGRSTQVMTLTSYPSSLSPSIRWTAPPLQIPPHFIFHHFHPLRPKWRFGSRSSTRPPRSGRNSIFPIFLI